MDKKGFTLVELIAVITLLGIISTIAIISITSVINKNREKTFELTVKNLIEISNQYKLDTGNFYATCTVGNQKITCENSDGEDVSEQKIPNEEYSGIISSDVFCISNGKYKTNGSIDDFHIEYGERCYIAS